MLLLLLYHFGTYKPVCTANVWVWLVCQFHYSFLPLRVTTDQISWLAWKKMAIASKRSRSCSNLYHLVCKHADKTFMINTTQQLLTAFAGVFLPHISGGGDCSHTSNCCFSSSCGTKAAKTSLMLCLAFLLLGRKVTHKQPWRIQSGFKNYLENLEKM